MLAACLPAWLVGDGVYAPVVPGGFGGGMCTKTVLVAISITSSKPGVYSTQLHKPPSGRAWPPVPAQTA
jgi:hypothetical protein